jgi:CheY-like chemotaxis protein
MNDNQSTKILSICDDEALRYSRQLVLESVGYEVESIPSDAPLDAVQPKGFEIAILCHSVDGIHAARLANELRRMNPNILVLRVHAIQGKQERLYDVDCEVLPDPVPLLNAIKSLRARTAGTLAEPD